MASQNRAKRDETMERAVRGLVPNPPRIPTPTMQDYERSFNFAKEQVRAQKKSAKKVR